MTNSVVAREMQNTLRCFATFVGLMSVFGPEQAARAESSLRPSTLALINKFMATVALAPSKSRLVATEIDTIGCPQDGQSGPQEAPTLPKTVRVIIPEGVATSLAFYSPYENENSGVLAPRGWDCFGTYGSNGSTLYVVPRRLDIPILDRPEKVKGGPAVIVNSFVGSTSGRFAVAKVSARIFPRARAFVERVRDEKIDDPSTYIFAPWPTDMLYRLSDFTVSYITPPGVQGLGTVFGPMPGTKSISGLVFLTDTEGKDDGPFLTRLAVRLDKNDQHLYPAIAVGMIASVDVTSANNGATAAAPSAGAIGVVSAFYEALGRADGAAASALVIPEKRDHGPFSALEITNYYSRLSEPLRLLAVSRFDDRSAHARYRYRSASGTVCDGEAIVTLRKVGEASLIESVRALKKC
jgi:hypothetical protein